ncbi:MAG: DUF58 domain-containing protein [Firmicutes bacterium]|nr:DUF58 domain-containing protein [Bacillota bacterium]MBQ7057740.1 DUF58 domain-containing protein [Bacillota bacterium]
MPILIILIVVGLVLWLQRVIYRRFWDRSLEASVRFSDYYLFEGSTTTLTEVMSNAKLLPLPWVHLKFQIFRNGKSDNLFRSDIFNILFNQQITRKSEIKLDKRGVYQIPSLDLLSYDLFITSKFVKKTDNQATITVFPLSLTDTEIAVPFEKLMGQIATKRYTQEDPFLFKGIRPYQPEDSFRDINFNASARAGEWLVNTHEYTLDQKVRIVLLTDKSTNYYDETAYEEGLRFAAALVSRLETEGIPVSFYSNGMDSLDHKEPFLDAGTSQNHTDAILELLARLDLSETGTPGTKVLENIQENRQADEFYVIISPDRSRQMLDAYLSLRDYTDACQMIVPVRAMDFFALPDEEKEREEKIENYYYHKI